MADENTLSLEELHDQDPPVTQEEENLGDDDDNIKDNLEIVDAEKAALEEKARLDAEELEKNKNPDDDLEGVLTGVEKFLSLHGIEGGMIQFEDGTKKHYDELTESEQFNVLKSIAESDKSSVEDTLGLDKDEITLLNYVRESGPAREIRNDI